MMMMLNRPHMTVALAVVASLACCALADYKCPAPGFQPFNCSTFTSTKVPTNVRQLTPPDIKGVMALGDSITAGFAMRDGPLEYRGTVYSTGGDDGALTIGNFLKTYNPDLLGQATGETIPLTKEGKGLNFAVSEARVKDVPGQIQRMAAKMNTSEYSHLYDEWKLLTLFIGANDICECNSMTAAQFEVQLNQSLTLIQNTFPKTFVNVMTIFNISNVWAIKNDRTYCEFAIPILHECSCLENSQAELQKMDDLAMAINAVTKKVVAEFAALNDPLFTAVVQPAIEDMKLSSYPKEDVQDLVSDLDCFHPSLCTDQGFAVGVWNNMFAPPQSKKTVIDPLNPPTAYCPTAGDFIQ
eukprot:m.84618 g.84618  ORF g.84618 m.84618 type:complete len:355 (+) comp12754_c0_seq1:65-1129(+)